MNIDFQNFLQNLSVAVIAPGAFWFGPGLTFAFLLFIWAAGVDVLNHPILVLEVAGVSVVLFGMLQNPLIRVLSAGHRMIASAPLALAKAIAWACESLHGQFHNSVQVVRTHGGRVEGSIVDGRG